MRIRYVRYLLYNGLLCIWVQCVYSLFKFSCRLPHPPIIKLTTKQGNWQKVDDINKITGRTVSSLDSFSFYFQLRFCHVQALCSTWKKTFLRVASNKLSTGYGIFCGNILSLRKYFLWMYRPMRKEVGWKWLRSIGLPLGYFSLRFSKKLVQAHPVGGLKLFSEPCLCQLRSIIVCN